MCAHFLRQPACLWLAGGRTLATGVVWRAKRKSLLRISKLAQVRFKKPMPDNHVRPQYVRASCEEPFRIFFPIGILLGVVGVSLWLLFYLGAGIPYPNVAHARLMIEGFMASFIFGFLGTAGPRITSAPHFSLFEVGTIFTLDLLAAGLHTGGAYRFGDICFLACLLFFASALVKRFRQRKDSPPPNFVLVALGLVSGIAGAALVAYAESAQYSRAYQFGSALLNECFVLLSVLGVAPFFIARLLDLPMPELPESRAFPPRWGRQAAFAAFLGIAIIVSFWIDVLNLPRTGGWIRVAAITLYVAMRFPFHGRSFLADCLRASLLSIVVGFIIVALLPIYRIAALHIVFITGFNFVAFTVAIRVVFGHSGNLPRLQKPLWFFIATIVLLFLAMISRFAADFAPQMRIAHLLGAAICWLIAALIWIVGLIPKVTVAESED
jgi:uncharacterized protein involved in response to NO